MKYNKPEVATAGTAVTSIQGQKQVNSQHDNKVIPNIFLTVSAYESDE